MISKEIEEEIEKIALKNALDYGKARADAVSSKLLSKFPEMRSDIKEVALRVKAIVEKINKMSRSSIEKEAEKYKTEFAEERKEKESKTSKPRFELEGAVKGSFLTRFPPEPNGYMQIGHAKAAFMEQEFAEIYDGKFALYFDDTNPEKERQEFVDAFKKDLKWLGLSFDLEYYASDNIESLYDHAKTLIKNGNAYVCSCDLPKIKEDRKNGEACAHRIQGREKNEKLWDEMLSGGASNSILRLKGDMKSENTVMRDPTLFRIKSVPHYRQGKKYTVWPTYDFNTPIIDSIKGVTDAIRSKEFELRDELYYQILELLRLRKPRIHSIARLEIEGNLTSKRKINELITHGQLWGYDDPRLVTIAGLRRRGISPKAIREFVLRFGLSKTDSRVKIEMLLAENRKVIDSTSKRLFFVENPRRLEVRGIPEELREVEIRLHPTVDLGYRRYKLGGTFFINAYDANNLRKGGELGLKGAFSVRIDEVGEEALSATYLEDGSKKAPRVQWVNEGNYVECKAYVIGNLLEGESFNKESMKLIDGYLEDYAKKMKEGDVVQFERVGFFRLDDKKEMSFISM